MWMKKNCCCYDRSRLRYPSDLTDEACHLTAAVAP